MQSLDAAPRRRWFLPCAGGTAALALGSTVWLAEPDRTTAGLAATPEEEAATVMESSVSGGQGWAANESSVSGAGEPAIGSDAVARVVAVKSWVPSDRAQPLIFVCPDSPVLGRTMALRRVSGGTAVAGLAVAAPEWTGPCEESVDGADRAGAALRVVVSPETYVTLISGDTAWNLGPLRVAFEPAGGLPAPNSPDEPVVAIR